MAPWAEGAGGARIDVKPPGGGNAAAPTGNVAIPGVLWSGTFGWWFGQYRPVCAFAWLLFVAIPALFFYFELPGLEIQLGSSREIARWLGVLFGISMLCFVLTGAVNPGVPPEPDALPDGLLPHPNGSRPPGKEPEAEYTLSRDTNRYVQGFDHFCEFVGNDIGRGNLPCFVGLLLSLALLSTGVVAASTAYVYSMWFPPHQEWHVYLDWWRLLIALSLCALLVYGLIKCWGSEMCAGVGPLILAMPGMSVGAVAVFFVVALTALLPLLSDMWDDVDAAANPAAFFLILPVLCFALLFWGMSAHWLWLLGSGLSQKVWLKAKGLRFGARREAGKGAPQSAAVLV